MCEHSAQGDALHLDHFMASLETSAPPSGLSPALEALWYERRGDWDHAHRIVQDIESADAAWVHAYLHRREGDSGNARYWYRRAGRPESKASLETEWTQLVEALLTASGNSGGAAL